MTRIRCMKTRKRSIRGRDREENWHLSIEHIIIHITEAPEAAVRAAMTMGIIPGVRTIIRTEAMTITRGAPTAITATTTATVIQEAPTAITATATGMAIQEAPTIITATATGTVIQGALTDTAAMATDTIAVPVIAQAAVTMMTGTTAVPVIIRATGTMMTGTPAVPVIIQAVGAMMMGIIQKVKAADAWLHTTDPATIITVHRVRRQIQTM